MKCFLLPALAVTALAVPAASLASQVPVTVNRAGAASIRACSTKQIGARDAVCYNQVTGIQIGSLDITKENVVRVSCDSRFPRTNESVRAQVAREFCPQVDAGTLAPAPFLL